MSWVMCASVAPPGDPGPPLRFFGPLGHAVRDHTAVGVYEVELRPDEDGPYWCWLDDGGAEPTHVSGSYDELCNRFLSLQPGGPTPFEEQALGQGRVLRMSVTILRDMPTTARGRVSTHLHAPDWSPW